MAKIPDEVITKTDFRSKLFALNHYLCSPGPDSISKEKGLDAAIDIINRIHLNNVIAGWWTDINTGLPKDRNKGEMLMLMVSEIAEVPEKSMFTIFDDHLPQRLMIEVELGDFCIRAFDVLGKRFVSNGPSVIDSFSEQQNTKLNFYTKGMSAERVNFLLMKIVRSIANAMEGYRKNKKIENKNYSAFQLDFYLVEAVCLAHNIARVAGLDIVGAIDEKVLYNQQRQDHKIESRQLDGGKAF